MAISSSHSGGFFVLGALLACCMTSIALFGFPAFHVGYWNAEPIMLAMLAFSTAISLWLCVGIACNQWILSVPRGNILVYGWGAWVIWQGISTALSPNPWRSWFGPPEQGEGFAWYLCATVLILQLSVLWSSTRFRLLFFGYSFVLMCILACLHFMSDPHNNPVATLLFPSLADNLLENWKPFVWPDYLGFMVAWWWISLMLSYPTLRLHFLLPVGVASIVILFASSNQAASVLVGYALLFILTVRILHASGASYFKHVSLLARKLAVVAVSLPLLWLFAAPWIPVNYSQQQSQSIPTRVMMNHAALMTLADDPSRLLVGRGFGQFTDDFFTHGLIRDVRVYDDGKHQPNWPMIRGYNYHTHNMAAETLLALGLVGFLLWFMLPIMVIWRLSESYFWSVVPMLAAVTMLQHFWFPAPQAMSLQALAWFLLIRNRLPHKLYFCFKSASPYAKRLRGTRWNGASSKTLRTKSTRGFLGIHSFALYCKSEFLRKSNAPTTSASTIDYRLSIVLLLIVSSTLVWSAYGQWRAIRYDMHMTDPFGERYGTPLTQTIMEEDIARGGDRLRAFFIATTKRMATHESTFDPKHIALYQMYLDAAANMARTPSIGAYNGQAVLYGYNALLTHLRSPSFDALRTQATVNYPDIAVRHTKRAPKREDIIAPFLHALYQSPHDPHHTKLMTHVETLLAIHPTHRSALWLAGKVLSEKEEFATEGREMMQLALTLGADRVFLIKHSEMTH